MKDWTVLHSVGLKYTEDHPWGEIDFVVMAPGKGIVCLEIKGGEVACREGVWQTRNRRENEWHRLKRSPHLQARGNMSALRRFVLENFGRHSEAARCPFFCATVFPDVGAPPQTPETQECETIDMEDLKQPLSRSVARVLSGRQDVQLSRAPSASRETLNSICSYLRPEFDRVITRQGSVREAEERIISLADEQYRVLDMTSENDRMVVAGAAGTGKTLLALEFARREAAHGRSVLLLCFNKLLGAWLARQIDRDDYPGITTGTFHSVLRDEIKNSKYDREFSERSKSESSSEVFQSLIPFYGELAVKERNRGFDTLVMDEAQDLIAGQNVDVLGSLVRGGLKEGRWALFGDFARQAIYGPADGLSGKERLRRMLTSHELNPVRLALRKNCRNTRQIAGQTVRLAGFETLPYDLSDMEGPTVEYHYWADQQAEASKLREVIDGLLGERFKPEDIVVLAPSRFERSAVRLLAGDLPIGEVGEGADRQPNKILFSTVHAFKGMESKVVVLTGFSDIESGRYQSLLYIGMSRARSCLVVLLHDSLRKVVSARESERSETRDRP